MPTEHLLLANTGLQAALEHLQTRAVQHDPAAVADVWREAQSVMERLQDKEAGCADDAPVLPLPAAMAPWADALTQSPEVNNAHRLVPVVFGLVEADAMMNTRRVLSESRLTALQAQLRTPLDDTDLAALCLPLPGVPARPAAMHWNGQLLQVLSDDGELQLLHAGAAQGTGASGMAAPGVAHGVLQLVVGKPLPTLHAVHLNGRVLLVNGHHRANALRAAGVTYLPCLISWCSTIDEVLAAAPTLQREEVQRCFVSDRPVMLRDFNRAALVHRYEARPGRHLLQLRIEVSSQWLP